MRVLHLYRPRLPGQRAQAIQVLHTCHALAERGHEVTLIADRGPAPVSPALALEQLGLAEAKGLDLRIAPLSHSGAAGVWFRRELARWWKGRPGVVLARDKRRLLQAMDTHPPRHRVILETHELDSALVADRGEDPQPILELETRCAAISHALVANCGGTLRAWEETHDALPSLRRVSHNATSPARAREGRVERDAVIRILGSARSFKGVTQLKSLSERASLPIEWIGASEGELRQATDSASVRFLPAVPYREVPDVLARSRVLLLPLQNNRFGRSLTSPLKLWDYLATGTPVVAPSLPTVVEIQELSTAKLHLYRPGDASDLERALTDALEAPIRTPFLRTWDERASELEALFE
jgi:hypothetical protein